ncbi:MAG: hypothetical protein WCV68_00035 [Candidatus Paceibacterota bacterium]|jgi:hypothetical protein
MGWLDFSKKKQIEPEDKSVPLDVECPYCQVPLGKFPSRKGVCPHCQKTYWVRTDPFSRERLVLTEDGVRKNEEQQFRYQLISEFKRSLFNVIGEDEFEKLYQETKEAFVKKRGKAPLEGDLMWSISNKMILLSAKSRDWRAKTGMIYWAQSQFVYGEGKDYAYIREKDFELELKFLRETGTTDMVEILATPNSCPECQRFDGKKFTIEEALDQKILPHKKCTTEPNKAGVGWCRCLYVPSLDHLG